MVTAIKWHKKYDKYQNTPPCYKQNNNKVASLRAFWNMKSRKRDQQHERFLQRPQKACNKFKGISSNSCWDICGKLRNIKQRHPSITLHWEKTIQKWNQSIYQCKSIQRYRPALSAQEAVSAEDKAEQLEKHNPLLYHSITEGKDGKKAISEEGKKKRQRLN